MKLITQVLFLIGVFVNSKDPRYKMERVSNQKSMIQNQMNKILNDNTLTTEKNPILNIVKKKAKQNRNKNYETYFLNNRYDIFGNYDEGYTSPNQYLCGLIVYLQYPDQANGLGDFGVKWCGFGDQQIKVIDNRPYNLLRKELYCMTNSFIYKIDSQFNKDKGIYDVRVFCYNPVSEKETVVSTYMDDQNLQFDGPFREQGRKQEKKGLIDFIQAQYGQNKITGIVNMKYHLVKPLCQQIQKYNVNDGTVCGNQVFNCEHYEQAYCKSCKKGYILQQGICVLKIFNCEDQHEQTCYKCFDDFTLQNNVCFRKIKECNRQIGGICIECKNGLNLKNNKCENMVPNCIIFRQGKCIQCENGYSKSPLGLCQETIKNCVYQRDGKCAQCQNGYKLGEDKCTKEIENCLENEQDDVCLQCKEGYISGGKNMISDCFVKIENCIEQIDNNCEQCDFNYILIDNTCENAPIPAKKLTRVEIEELIKAQQPAADQTPAEDKPKDQAPAQQTPAEDKPKDQVPAEDKPKEDPPKEDPPKEDPPKEDPPKEKRRLNKQQQNETK